MTHVLCQIFQEKSFWNGIRYVKSHAHRLRQCQPGRVPQVGTSNFKKHMFYIRFFKRPFPIDFSWKIGYKTCAMFIFFNMKKYIPTCGTQPGWRCRRLWAWLWGLIKTCVILFFDNFFELVVMLPQNTKKTYFSGHDHDVLTYFSGLNKKALRQFRNHTGKYWLVSKQGFRKQNRFFNKSKHLLP